MGGVVDFVGDVKDTVFGGGNSPGMLGTGRFQATTSEFRNDQKALLEILKNRATGQGESIAGMQAQQASQRELANNMSLINSASGLSPALVARLGQRAQETASNELVRQENLAKLQEQTAYLDAYQQAIEKARSQDEGLEAINQQAFSDAAENRSGLVKEGAKGAASVFAASMCWVARAVFGVENPKWMYARHFIVNIGPKWFCDLYQKHGEDFAKKVERNKFLKLAITPVFEIFADLGHQDLNRRSSEYMNSLRMGA